ncbi:MAG: hypothetical protein OEY44_02760 [Candidatus Peregrinibacteria bacterium]|nr:hypothetical protein [Candidatus Peregrinibacteria bacterium]
MKSISQFIKGFLIVLGLALVLGHTPAVFAQDDDLANLGGQSAEQLLGDEALSEESLAESDARIDAELENELGQMSLEEEDYVGYDQAIGYIKPAPGPQEAKNSESIIRDVAETASKVHRFFAPLINFFSFQIGNFLGNDYVYHGAMGDMLHKVWVISRNLVNIAFVFLLLWIAIKEIFFVGKETELKRLITFTLLLIAVNFSWLATKVVLDAANVVTQVVFAIPSGLGNAVDTSKFEQCQVNTLSSRPIKGACMPSAYVYPADSGTNRVLYWLDTEEKEDDCSKALKAYGEEGSTDGAYNQDGTINENASEDNKKFQRKASICMEQMNFFKYDRNLSVVYLTYGMARIQNLTTSTVSGSDGIQLSVGVLMSLVIQVAYSVGLAALFFALILRMAMLWLLVAFSPFLILTIWFNEKMPQEISSYFSIAAFMNWAFIPAKVGAIFSVSFIMISAGQAAGSVKTTIVDKVLSESGFVHKMLEPQSIFMGQDGLQTFIWLLMSLVILWIGVFTVLSKTGIAGFDNIMSQVKEGGKKVAIKAATAPYWAGYLPLGEGGTKTSVKQLVQAVNPLAALDRKYEEAGGKAVGTRNLALRAKDVDFGKIEGIFNTKAGQFHKSDANQIAGMYQFRNIEHMLKEDDQALLEAFRKSKGYRPGSDFDQKLLNALKTFKEKGAAPTPQRPRPATPGGVPEATEGGEGQTPGGNSPEGTPRTAGGGTTSGGASR